MRSPAPDAETTFVAGQRILGFAAVGAVAVALVPGIGGGDTPAAALPPPPEVAPFQNSAPVAPEDGLVHVIVTPNGTIETPDDTPPAPSDPTVDDDLPAIGASDGFNQWSVDPDIVDQLPADSQLVLVDGVLAARLPNGEIVLLEEAATDPGPDHVPADPGTMPAISLGHPVIDELAGTPGVVDIQPIGDGSFAVAVESEAVLDGFALDIAEDTLLAITDDPYQGYQWALENNGSNLNGVSNAPPQTPDADIDAGDAWPRATGRGVVVAVIDSGVDFSHPDLAANRWTNPAETCGNGVDDDGNGFVDDCHGWDFGYDDPTPFNPGAHAHGTHVAGIVAAEANNGIGVAGVAPNATIMDLNVGTLTASGQPSITSSALARAIRYAADNGADVINLSLGTPPGTPRSALSIVDSAIVHAGNQGVLVVVAAGNDSVSLDAASVWPASYDFPHVLTVSATAPDETLASFSNYGSVVDLAAPGHVILSTAPAANGNYLFMSGTSQATPVVAGVAALRLELDPSLSPATLISALRDTADRHQSYTAYVPTGARVNAANSVGTAEPVHGFDEVAVSVSGLAGVTAGDPLTASFDIVVPADEYPESYQWETSAFAVTADGTFALAGLDVAVDGSPRLTDARGAVAVGSTGSARFDLSTTLPAGEYALVLEAVPTDDPDSRLGDPMVLSFTVAADPEPVVPVPTEPEPVEPIDPPPTPTDPSPTEPGPTPNEPEPIDPVDPAPEPTPEPSDPTPTEPTPGEPSPTPTEPTPEPTPTEPTPEPDPMPAPPPDPVTSGDWSIVSVTPGSGPVSTPTLVRLAGSFPKSVYVWFGEQPGVVVSQTKTTIDVITPFRADPAVVDITLRRTGVGTLLELPNGFTFEAVGTPAPDPTDPDPTPGDPSPTDPAPTEPTPVDPAPTEPAPGEPTDPSPTDPGPNPTDPTPDEPAPGEPDPTPTDPGDPDPAPAPAPGPSDPADPGDPTDPGDPGDPPGTEPPVTNPPTTTIPNARQARTQVALDLSDLGNGLRGARVLGADPVSSATRCTADPCKWG